MWETGTRGCKYFLIQYRFLKYLGSAVPWKFLFLSADSMGYVIWLAGWLDTCIWLDGFNLNE